MALGNKLVQVLTQRHLLLIGLPKGVVLGSAHALLRGSRQLVVVGRDWVHHG